jgi:DNA-binding IclR family transcriptional regulator
LYGKKSSEYRFVEPSVDPLISSLQSDISDARDQASVKSIEVGLRLLPPLVSARGPLGLKTLADAAGMAPAKAHRYLVALVRTGLVQRNPDRAVYSLGPLALRMGLAAIGTLDVNRAGCEAADRLCDRTGQTACLCIPSPEGPLVLHVATPPYALFAGLRVGAVLPPETSASGRVIAAWQAPLAAGAREVAVREAGWASVRDAVMPGMSGAAAPAFDCNGHLVMVLAVLGPTDRIDLSPRRSVIAALLEEADGLCARLGHGAGAR